MSIAEGGTPDAGSRPTQSILSHRSTAATGDEHQGAGTVAVALGLASPPGRGLKSGEASERLALSRSSLYRWQRRLAQEGPRGLEERSRKPRRRRSPTWSPELAQAVLRVREQYPRWGKDKLVVLLRRAGWSVSTSMVGRILSRLKARGVLREPPRSGIAVRPP